MSDESKNRSKTLNVENQFISRLVGKPRVISKKNKYTNAELRKKRRTVPRTVLGKKRVSKLKVARPYS